MKSVLTVLIVVLLLATVTGCQNTVTKPTTENTLPANAGVMEGKASIGPVADPSKPYPPELYQPRKVMAYDAGRGELIKEAGLDENGYYRIELPENTYIININYYENDWSNNAPRRLKITAGVHIMFDIDFHTGDGLILTPRPGETLSNPDGLSSLVTLETVHLETTYSQGTYHPVSGTPQTIKPGDLIYEITGTIRNNHPEYREIALWAAGFDETGRQILWTLDAAHIMGQIGRHLEKGETGDFALHLNYAEKVKTIRIFAGIYSQTPP